VQWDGDRRAAANAWLALPAKPDCRHPPGRRGSPAVLVQRVRAGGRRHWQRLLPGRDSCVRGPRSLALRRDGAAVGWVHRRRTPLLGGLAWPRWTAQRAAQDRTPSRRPYVRNMSSWSGT